MRTALKFGAISLVVSYYVACSPVKFDKAPEPPCGGEGVSCVQKCEGPDCIESYMLDRVVGKGLVDILIVNDNSGSMSYEQKKMGNAFGSFLSSLDKIDYRIGMVTTDISFAYAEADDPEQARKNYPGPYNGNGSLQDGKLIDFGSGVKFLTNETANKETLFANTISRAETLHCETSGYKECPSNDERGIFAANLALDRNEFLRPTAHLAVVVLADEDERGVSPLSARTAEEKAIASMYPQKERDKPATFVAKFKELYPSKTLSVHSIIVKPGDTTCKTTQSSQGNFVRGTEGGQYAELTKLAGGKLGSICEAYYDKQLQDIGAYIQEKTLTLPFSCRPINDVYKVEVTPTLQVQTTPDWSKMELTINTPLPPMTKVKLSYECLKR